LSTVCLSSWEEEKKKRRGKKTCVFLCRPKEEEERRDPHDVCLYRETLESRRGWGKKKGKGHATSSAAEEKEEKNIAPSPLRHLISEN